MRSIIRYYVPFLSEGEWIEVSKKVFLYALELHPEYTKLVLESNVLKGVKYVYFVRRES